MNIILYLLIALRNNIIAENNFKNEFTVVGKVLLLINPSSSTYKLNFLLPCICSEIFEAKHLKLKRCKRYIGLSSSKRCLQ